MTYSPTSPLAARLRALREAVDKGKPMPTPPPAIRLPPALNNSDRSALTLALYRADAIASVHYTDGMPHYLVKPGMGQTFREVLWLHGCVCGECYHQDGDPSGLSDWRKIERV